MTGSQWLAVPHDWSDAVRCIVVVLERYADVFDESGMVEMQSIVDGLPGAGGIERMRLNRVLETTIDTSPGSEGAAALTLAVARLLPLADYEFFIKRPGLWRRCAEIAASRPLDYGERSRVLQEVLLCNYCRDELFAAEAEGRLDEFLQVLRSDVFMSSHELGLRVAQNAMLALVRELTRRPSQLRMIGRYFPEMKALVRMVEALDGGS